MPIWREIWAQWDRETESESLFLTPHVRVGNPFIYSLAQPPLNNCNNNNYMRILSSTRYFPRQYTSNQTNMQLIYSDLSVSKHSYLTVKSVKTLALVKFIWVDEILKTYKVVITEFSKYEEIPSHYSFNVTLVYSMCIFQQKMSSRGRSCIVMHCLDAVTSEVKYD